MTKPTEIPPAAETAAAPVDPLTGLCRGRIVHYWPLAYEARNAEAGPWPAMVTNVGVAGKCTLNVNMPVPTPIGEDPVARRTEVPFAAEATPGHWTWMFQGQGSRYDPNDRKAST